MVKLFRFREQSLWEAPVFYCNAPAALREPRLCGRGLCCHVVRAFVDVNQCRRGKKKSSRFWPTSCVLPPRLRDAAIRPGLFLKPPENTHFHRDLFSSFSAVRSLCPGIVRARQRPGDGGWGRVSAVEGVALCCVSVFKSVFQCVCEIGFVFIPSGFFVFFGDTWTQSGHKVYIFLSFFFFGNTFPSETQAIIFLLLPLLLLFFLHHGSSSSSRRPLLLLPVQPAIPTAPPRSSRLFSPQRQQQQQWRGHRWDTWTRQLMRVTRAGHTHRLQVLSLSICCHDDSIVKMKQIWWADL